jgi:hypothetical protein
MLVLQVFLYTFVLWRLLVDHCRQPRENTHMVTIKNLLRPKNFAYEESNSYVVIYLQL